MADTKMGEFERVGVVLPGQMLPSHPIGDEAAAVAREDGTALSQLIECTAELQGMQRARAEKSNLIEQAGEHVRNAIRCIEEQAQADSRAVPAPTEPMIPVRP